MQQFQANDCAIVYRMCSLWTSNWMYSASTRTSWLGLLGQRMHQASSMAHSMLLARGIVISCRITSSIFGSRSCIPSRNSAKLCWSSRPNSFRSHFLSPPKMYYHCCLTFPLMCQKGLIIRSDWSRRNRIIAFFRCFFSRLKPSFSCEWHLYIKHQMAWIFL